MIGGPSELGSVSLKGRYSPTEGVVAKQFAGKASRFLTDLAEASLAGVSDL